MLKQVLSVSVDSFDGASLVPLDVVKKAEKANLNLLDEDDMDAFDEGPGGILSSMRSAFGMESQRPSKPLPEPETIHVFSVASGRACLFYYYYYLEACRRRKRRVPSEGT